MNCRLWMIDEYRAVLTQFTSALSVINGQTDLDYVTL